MRGVVVLGAKEYFKVSICQVKLSALFFLFILFFAINSFSTTALAQSRQGNVMVTGEASVEIADYFETGKYTLRYFIIDRQSRARTEVFFPGPSNAPVDQNFRTGNIISVQGTRHPNGFGIDYQGMDLVEAFTEDIPADSAPDANADAPIATPETRKVLTLVVDFNDAAVHDYITPANTPNGPTVQNVKDRMFHETKNVAHFYNTASLGTLTIPSDPNELGEDAVYGPYKIDYDYLGGNPALCQSSVWVDAALTLWEADTGQDRLDYRHHSLIIPNYWDYSNRNCTFGGQANLGCGTTCWAVNSDPASIMHGVISHEIGHNFGFNHASTDTNNDGVFESEYGDGSDFMGGSRNWMKFNPPHFEYKGWYDPATYELRTITPTSTLQSVDLIPVDEEDTDWPGLRAIKTARTETTNYYFSYRQQTGHYDNVTSSYTTGISLHWRSNTSYSYFYRMIEPGQVFVDATADLLVYAVGPMTIDNIPQTDTTEVFTLKFCNTTCATLIPPLQLAGQGTTPYSVQLTWEDYTYNEDGFTIEVSPDGSIWSSLATVAANSTSHIDSGLSEGTTYYYRVRAYRASETSDWSSIVSATTPAASGTIGLNIATSDDDVIEATSSGSMWMNGRSLYLDYDSWNARQNDEGIRFRNIPIPQGSSINSAYIEYRAYNSGTGTNTITFRTEDVDDAAIFTSASNSVSSRTLGVASVDWALSDWPGGSIRQSPDLSSIIQPVINRAGWAGGNSMIFVTESDYSGSHVVYSYDGSQYYGHGNTYSPKLVIDYTWTPTESYTVGGNVSGLTGTGLVLQNNAGDDLPVGSDGDFVFPTALIDGSTFAVSVLTQPISPGQSCNVSNGSGTLTSANITDVSVTCTSSCNVNDVSGLTEYSDATHEACELLVLGPDFIAADGSNVSANSGWEIEFQSGFIVEQGATLNANVCGQSLCLPSPSPMPYGCHSCVDQICNIDSNCCALEFNQACVNMVDTVCGLVCE
jgi:hypothetical protein